MVWIKYKDRIHNKTIDLEVSEEVARYLWANDIYWRRLMKKARKYECSYFETISDDGDEIEFIETIKDESVDIEQEVDNKIFAEIIWKVAEKLQPLQKEILIERFKKDMKLCDIAKKHNMSKSALTQFLKTTYKHFVFFLARDKDFIKTDFWQSHCKDFTDEFIDTLEEGLTNENFEFDLDKILDFAKGATQAIKIADKLGVGLSSKQKKLWQFMSKTVTDFIKSIQK